MYIQGHVLFGVQANHHCNQGNRVGAEIVGRVRVVDNERKRQNVKASEIQQRDAICLYTIEPSIDPMIYWVPFYRYHFIRPACVRCVEAAEQACVGLRGERKKERKVCSIPADCLHCRSPVLRSR